MQSSDPDFSPPLLAGSPAINAGGTVLAPPLDQRGLLRAGPSDIGAFEFNASPIRITSITRLADGLIMLQGSGAINRVHTIHASPDLSVGKFESIGPATANSSGVFQFEDTNAGTFPRRFYRASYP